MPSFDSLLFGGNLSYLRSAYFTISYSCMPSKRETRRARIVSIKTLHGTLGFLSSKDRNNSTSLAPLAE